MSARRLLGLGVLCLMVVSLVLAASGAPAFARDPNPRIDKYLLKSPQFKQDRTPVCFPGCEGATIAITASGIEPAYVEVYTDVPVRWENQTAYTVTLEIGKPYRVYLPLVVRGGSGGREEAPIPSPFQARDGMEIGPGEVVTQTYTTPGIYDYYWENRPDQTVRVVVTQQPFDFSMTITPPSNPIQQGQVATYNVGLELVSGDTEAVSLSLGGAPQDAQVSLLPGSVTPDGWATLVVTTSLATPVGQYTLEVTGTAGATVHAAQAALVVTPHADFLLSTTDASQTVVQGAQTNYAVTVTSLYGFEDLVTLDVDGLPAGATAQWDDNTVTPTAGAVLAVTAAIDTPTGPFTLTVSGTGGGFNHALELYLGVTPHPDFALSTLDASQSVVQGEQVSYTISADAFYGFSQPVDLWVSGLPVGANSQWSMDPVTPAAAIILSVTAAIDTPTGPYTFTIHGTGGGFTHQLVLDLEITPHPDFNLAIDPSSVGILAGLQAVYTATVEPLYGFSAPVTMTVSGLPAGATPAWQPNPVVGRTGSSVLTISTTKLTAPGSYPLEIKAAGGGYTHTIEVNLSIGALADLVIQEMFTDPSPAEQGEPFTMTAVVFNQGAGDAGAFEVTWGADRMWPAPFTTVYSGSWQVNRLDSGAPITLTSMVSGTTPGGFTLDAEVDAGDTVLELEEDNNTYTGEIGVQGVVDVCGYITEDATWAYATYRVTCGINVQSQATLTIREGAVVKFNEGQAIAVYGRLVAQGEAIEPVVFTSYRDGTYGSTLRGVTETPVKGDWQAVWAASGGRVEIEHAVLRYAGRWTGGAYYTEVGGMMVNGGTANLSDVTVEQSNGRGIWVHDNGVFTGTQLTVQDNRYEGMLLQGGSLALTDSLVQRNGKSGVNATGTLAVSGCTIQQNTEYGIWGQDLSPVITDTVILSNTLDAVYFYNSWGNPGVDYSQVGNLTLAGNRFDGLVVGGYLAGSGTLPNTTGEVFGLDTLTIHAGGSLVIDPGVIVKVRDGSSLVVNGMLDVEGTSLDPVIFTSIHDDSVGGDTNYNGSATLPAKGNWQSIWVNSGGRVEMEHAELRYGGSWAGNPYWDTIGMLMVTGGKADLTDVLLEQSNGRGAWVKDNGVFTGTQITVQDNRYEGILLQGGGVTLVHSLVQRNGRTGISATGKLAISGCTFQLNTEHGIWGQDLSPVITDTVILSNTLDAVYFYNSWGNPGVDYSQVGNLTLVGNRFDGLVVGGYLAGSGTLPNTTGEVFGLDTLTIHAGGSLVIDPGVIVKVRDGSSLVVNGMLEVEGTSLDPVIFTSIHDDSVGGDTNHNGSATLPAKGNWQSIWANAGGQVEMEHAELRYGGSWAGNPYWDTIGMLMVTGGKADLTDVLLEQSNGRGAWVKDNGVFTGTELTVQDNRYEGILLQGGEVTLVDSLVQRNGRSGVNATGTLVISGSVIQLNTEHGIYGTDLSPVVTDTVVQSNTLDAVYLYNGWGNLGLNYSQIGNLTLSGNRADGIILGGYLGGSSTWPNTTGEVFVLDNLTVHGGGTLTIEAGVVVKVREDQWLVVNGTLLVAGTALQPVVFTSLTDDTVGGDTNNDGGAILPTKGYWQAIWVYEAGGRVEMEHASLRYGGHWTGGGYGTEVGLVMVRPGGVAELTDVILEQSNGRGIWVQNTGIFTGTRVTAQDNRYEGVLVQTGQATLVDSLVQRNGTCGVNASGKLAITGSVIQLNTEHGIYGTDLSPVITDTVVQSNTLDGVYLNNSWGNPGVNYSQIGNLTLSGNRVDGLVVAGYLGGSSTWPNTTGQVFVLDALSIHAGASLGIDAGVIVKVREDQFLQVNGTLLVSGTAAQPAVFTSLPDDTVGGDTNGDGGATLPVKGYWKSIWANSGGRVEMEHSELRYGGHWTPWEYGTEVGLVTVRAGGVTELTDVTLEQSNGRGIWVQNTGIFTGTRVTAQDNRYEGVLSHTGKVTLVDSLVQGNGYSGVNASGVLVISGSVIQQNGEHGAYGTDLSPVITDTVVQSNTWDAVYLNNSWGNVGVDYSQIGNLTLSGNRADGLVVAGYLGGSSTWPNTTGQVFVLDNLTVHGGATLTIDAGVIVKVREDQFLQVNGTLLVSGTAAQPAVFTSLPDDTVGGDTNGDGGATLPVKGYWKSIWANSGGRVEMEHSELRYGGHWTPWEYYTVVGLVTVRAGGVAELTDVTLEQSNGRGIWVQNTGIFTGTRMTVQDNQYEGVLVQTGQARLVDSLVQRNGTSGVNASGKLAITGSVIQLNTEHGIYGTDLSPVITDTVVQSNTLDGVYLYNGWGNPGVNYSQIGNLSLNGNRVDGLVVAGYLGGSSTWPNTTGQVFVLDALSIHAGASLEINAGVVVKVREDQLLEVNGTLLVEGTAGQPVVFTSLTDDTVGDDTNNDGGATLPAKGYWRSIWANSGGRVEMEHSELRYGGHWTPWEYYTVVGLVTVRAGGVAELTDVTLEQSNGRGIWVQGTGVLTGTRLTLQENAQEGVLMHSGKAALVDCTVQLNSGSGIYISAGTFSLMDSQVLSNTSSGLVIVGSAAPVDVFTTTFSANDVGIYFGAGTTPTLLNNSIAGNTTWGLQNATTILINAVNHWWGAASGPTHASNPGGTGDKVTDWVTFTPWLVSSP